MNKTNAGNFFEDFTPGQVFKHATPRTVTVGDVALYTALYGSRFAMTSADTFATRAGMARSPLDDMLVFHIVFGKTVPDISLNAVANLGYAECRFIRPVFTGDTISTTSTVLGVKENSTRKTGTVYVRSVGVNQSGDAVLDYVRWVMVRKRDEASPTPTPCEPKLMPAVAVEALIDHWPAIDPAGYDLALAGSPHRWGDYTPGERIDHVDGMTIEEAEHQLATRLYQNTAKVHFNHYTESKGRFGRRLVYGGHIISLARALSFNGLGNAFHIAAINGGRHVAPCFGGDTIHAWSQILEKAHVRDRTDVGALRVRTIATKDQSCADFPLKGADGTTAPCVVLDLDYWVIMPK